MKRKNGAKSGKQFRFRVKDDQFKASGWCGNRPKCVSVAITAAGVAVRDTKDPEKQTLFFTTDEWDAFIKGAKDGQFDPRA